MLDAWQWIENYFFFVTHYVAGLRYKFRVRILLFREEMDAYDGS